MISEQISQRPFLIAVRVKLISQPAERPITFAAAKDAIRKKGPACKALGDGARVHTGILRITTAVS